MSTSDLYRQQRKQYSNVRCESLSCDGNATISGSTTHSGLITLNGGVSLNSGTSGSRVGSVTLAAGTATVPFAGMTGTGKVLVSINALGGGFAAGGIIAKTESTAGGRIVFEAVDATGVVVGTNTDRISYWVISLN